LRDGNNANVNGVGMANGQYKLQRVTSTNTPLSTAPVTNPEAYIQFSLPSSGLKETEGWDKSNINRKFIIFR
jgi:hypothetical protein